MEKPSKHLKSIKINPMYSSQKFVCHLPVQPPPSAKTKQNKKLLTVLKNHYVLEAAAGYAKGRTQMVAAHCNFFFL